MSSHLSVGADKALPITASDRDPATIINSSGGTLYYKNADDVDSGDSSLATGANVEVTTTNWIVASASTHVLVLRNDDRGDAPYPESREQIRTVDGPVQSGTNAISGTLAGIAETDTVVYDKSTKSLFVNEGTAASTYWTPVSYDTPGLVAGNLNGDVPIAGTDMSRVVSNGVRVFGQGAADTDSGVVAQAASVEGSNIYRATATNEAEHLIALGSAGGIFQPDTTGVSVVDVEWTNVSDILTRSMFVGFTGAAADALDPLITFATTTATFTADDLVGATFSSELTDADRWYTVSEKGNAGGTQALATTGNTSVDCPAAATYQRVRVEVRADGTAYVWFDKTLFATVIAGASGAGAHASAISYDVDEEFSPVAYLYVTGGTTALSADVKRFSYWGGRS